MIPQLFAELHLILEKYFPNETLKQIIKKIHKETDIFLDEILGNSIKILGNIIEVSKKHQTFLGIVKMFLVIHLKDILTKISQLRLYREKIQDRIMDQNFALKYMYGFSQKGELLFDIEKNIDRILDTIDFYIMLFTENVFQNHELEVHYL